MQAKEKASSHMSERESGENVADEAPEVEFYSVLQERLDEGEYIDFNEVEELYSLILQGHSILTHHIRRAVLHDKILQNIKDVHISHAQGNLPAACANVGFAQTTKDIKGDILSIFQCAKIIRQAISNASQVAWAFTGSLTDEKDHAPPAELLTLVWWILHGTRTTTSES